MLNLRQIIFASVLVCALLSTAAAQDSASSQKSTLTITAAAAGDRVRITAPASVVQMHVEVYAAGGERVFDQEIRGGNVFDWHLQDGQAQRLAPGVYVCVVTAKSVSGRLTQKLGAVTVAEKSANVMAGSPQLSLQQTQAIGPVEGDSSWTIAGEIAPQTPTVIANDGTDGQMIRGRGALTFRIGNFFSGVDQEQMRLTEGGNLGIGTSTPQSKLDVVGTIRAERFLVVKPNVTSGDKTAAGTQTSAAVDSIQPLVGGTGTQNRLAKWLETGGAGTLGDSGVTEVAGNVGIGTTSPQSALHLRAGLNKNIWFRDAGPTQKAQIISVADDNGTINTLSLDAAPLILNSQSSSNVGVGTTAPQARLDIEAIDGAGSQATEVLRIGKGTMDAGGDEAYINFVNASNTLGRVGVVAEGSGTGDLFLSVANAGAVSKAVTVNFNGNVGIGTTTPLAKLDVRGDVFVGLTAPADNTTTPGNNIYLGDDGGGDPQNSYRIDAYQNNLYLVARSGNAPGNPSAAGAGIVFRTGPAGGGELDRMTINPNGNVGIGTTNPGSLLTLNSGAITNTALEINQGAIKVTGASIGGSTPVFIHVANASNILSNTTRINHPLTNGDPNAILIITANYNPGQTFQNHPIGVSYTGTPANGYWAIFNQDGNPMQIGNAFNVLVVKP